MELIEFSWYNNINSIMKNVEIDQLFKGIISLVKIMKKVSINIRVSLKKKDSFSSDNPFCSYQN